MPVQTRSQCLRKMMSEETNKQPRYNRTLRSHSKKYKIILNNDGIMTRSKTKFLNDFKNLIN